MEPAVPPGQTFVIYIEADAAFMAGLKLRLATLSFQPLFSGIVRILDSLLHHITANLRQPCVGGLFQHIVDVLADILLFDIAGPGTVAIQVRLVSLLVFRQIVVIGPPCCPGALPEQRLLVRSRLQADRLAPQQRLAFGHCVSPPLLDVSSFWIAVRTDDLQKP